MYCPTMCAGLNIGLFRVSRHNCDKGTLNASSCIILFCQNVHTTNSKLGFMKIHTLNGIFQAFLPYSTPCRPATKVSMADPKGQIIWPCIYIYFYYVVNLIQNALLYMTYVGCAAPVNYCTVHWSLQHP